MSSPSVPSDVGDLSPLEEAIANKVLDSLRFRIQRLIDQELSATTPYRGKAARKSSRVQSQYELFDDEGRLIFG